MADLCGPSNALQNFQKHSAADRTLQQDRLINRQTPSQGFRQASSVNAGILDPEFDAFQAGHSVPLQPEFHHPPPHLAQNLQHFGPQQSITQASGWASDFQRLNISTPVATPVHQQPFRPQAQAQAGASSWHQDFLQRQAPVPQTQPYPQNMLGGVLGYGMGGYSGPSFHQSTFGASPVNQTSSVAQGKQRAQEELSGFDDAAFERAFDQAHTEMLEAEGSNVAEQAHPEMLKAEGSKVAEELQTSQWDANSRMLDLQNNRQSAYLAYKCQLAISEHNYAQANKYLDELESLERTGAIVNIFEEAKLCIMALQSPNNVSLPNVRECKSLLEADPATLQPAEAKLRLRMEKIIIDINERLMSSYPHKAPLTRVEPSHILSDPNRPWEIKAQWPPNGTEPKFTSITRDPNYLGADADEVESEERPQQNQDDDMAQTAGQLLESVADNTSEKFQNSQFLELMRRLRDREVRLEGDKVVELGINSSETRP